MMMGISSEGVRTTTTPMEEMQLLVREIVRNLDEITGLEQIWARGVVHRGGPHYRLKGTLGPVSLGEDECLVFGRLILAFRPRNCFIIGNAFGMSSAFIAKMMEKCGGTSVITLDSKGEGDGERCYRTSSELRERLECTILQNKVGWSPQDIDTAVDDPTYDLIFIDGDHSHPQVTHDFRGILQLVRAETIVCWHDYWMKGVPESVAEAEKSGFSCVKVNSSCEMVLGTRSPTVFRNLQDLFGTAEAPKKKLRVLAWVKLYCTLLSGAARIYVLRRT